MHRHASLLILAGLMTASLHAQTAPPAPPSPTPAVATPSQRTPPPARVATTPPLAPTQVPPPARAAQTAPPSKLRPGSDVPPPVYPQGAPPSAPRPGTAQPTTPPSPAAAPRRSDDEIRMPTQNVRVDLQITDSPGSGTPAKKVVTMLVADGRMGRIRSSNNVQVSEGAPNNMFSRQILINIDATPIVRPDGRILLSLTVEYVPDVAQGASKPASVNESLTVIVGDGKSTLISQSADPATDRRVTVEVLATVVR